MNFFAPRPNRGCFGTLALTALVVGLAGCASSGSNRAPVEDRKPQARVAVAAPAAASAVPAAGADVRLLPGAENAGKPGYHTVKAGESLIRIALENGQNWRDVQRWNALDNPNLIEVGQVLRVAPPLPEVGAAVARPVQPAGRVESRPLDARTAASAPLANPAPPQASAPVAASAPPVAPAVSATPAPTPVKAPSREGDEDVNWQWPAAGPVATAFDEARSKGLALTGKAGDPVLAAADGRVVYAGSGLRGYGNLVIVKHNATYLTAYAHNQTLLVKDEQVVRRGQKIAEMGSSDADRVQLHFEIRRLGVPIDPQKLLPAR
jgi:lipoprotein NlpD